MTYVTDAKTAASSFKNAVENRKASILAKIKKGGTVYGDSMSLIMTQIKEDINNCTHPTLVVIPESYIKDLTENQKNTLTSAIKNDLTFLGFGVTVENLCTMHYQGYTVTVSYL